MSTAWEPEDRRGRAGAGRRRRRRSVLPLLGCLAGLAVVAAGGSLIVPQVETAGTPRAPLVGRTSTVCPASPTTARSSTVTVATVRQAPDREGALAVVPVGTADPVLTLTEQGRARRVPNPERPVVLRGEGVLATAAGGATLGLTASGALAGLTSASCSPPTTASWFAGVGAEPDQRTDLVITNPNDAQAVVDLRFFGPDGIVVVPGSPAVVVEANSTRTVGLEPLVNAAGPLTVSVRASEGRVSVKALDQRSVGAVPAGADWHEASIAPRRTLVVPAVPEGAGSRQLVVTNPGRDRATVSVEVLGQQGAFAPAGAETVAVEGESTTTVDLRTGLAGLPAGLRLRSDRPVTGALLLGSERSGAQADIAVLPASAPLVRTGLAPVATLDGLESELVLSNAGDTEARVAVDVLNDDGVSLRTDSVLLVPGGTSTRRLTGPAPSYLVVGVPDGSAVHGGVVLTQPEGPTAGLTVLPITSPDVASRAPAVRRDPGVAR